MARQDRRCWVSLLCALVVATLALPALATEFPDVPTDHWAWCYIQGVSDAGIVSGYDDGLYRPEQPVTRDQMAVYIARAIAGGDGNVPDPGCSTPPFTDVPCDQWARKYIQSCVSEQVVQGYEDGTYQPGAEVMRDQMAVYVARAMVAPSGEAGLADYVPADPRNFPDVASTFWAYKHVEYCVEHGVVQGYLDGYYYPGNVVTRDQMAVYVCRAFDLATPPPPYVIGEYWWPLGQGNTWTYSTLGGGSETQTVSGTITLSGKVYSRMVYSDGWQDFMLVDAEGVHLGGSLDGSNQMTMVPAVLIPSSLQPGQSSSMTFTVYQNGVSQGAGSIDVIFAGVETVTTPTGTFPYCIKLDMNVVFPGEGSSHWYMWLAKGVGAVKQDYRPFGEDRANELTAATVGGIDYPINMADYFPLDQGDTWNYQRLSSATGSSTVNLTVSGSTTIAGQLYANVVRTPSTWIQIEYWQVAADGLRRGGELGDEGQLTLDPPLLVPSNLAVGQTILGSTTPSLDGVVQEPLTFTITFTGVETVTVPAGTFPNCLKLDVRLQASDQPGPDQLTLWFAKGVGKVREYEIEPDGVTDDSQLTSATVGGVEFP
jgi:hypothetical protein